MTSRVASGIDIWKKFDLRFHPQHMPPQITKGKWLLSTDGVDEIDVVDENGNVIASFDASNYKDREEMLANIQCFLLVPLLVRGVYSGMRALKDNMPDNETADSISNKLSELLRECYCSPDV